MPWMNLVVYILSIIICLGWCVISKLLETNFAFIFLYILYFPASRQFSSDSGECVSDKIGSYLFDPDSWSS